MRTATILSTALLLCVISGCTEPLGQKTLLSIDFEPDQVLRYEFNSVRDINWTLAEQDPKSYKKHTESVRMIVVYEPLQIDEYGLTKVKGTFESVKAQKSAGTGRDAAETLTGKSFVFTVGPNGKIHDNSELFKLLKKAGDAAFRRTNRSTDIKDPDLLDDVIATQWFLWDAVSSIKEPAEGLTPGQQWQSRLLVPTSMVIREGRDVVYRLDEVRETPSGRLAVISSTYTLADSAPKGTPIPYSGRFRLAGPFGFLRTTAGGLKATSLQGGGEELFNIDAGRTEQYEQHYRMTIKTGGSPLPGLSPRIDVEQTITMKRLED